MKEFSEKLEKLRLENSAPNKPITPLKVYHTKSDWKPTQPLTSDNVRGNKNNVYFLKGITRFSSSFLFAIFTIIFTGRYTNVIFVPLFHITKLIDFRIRIFQYICDILITML